MGIALSTFQKPRSGSTPLTVEASDNILSKPATETTIDAKEKREQEEFLGQFQLTLVNQELRIKQAISQLQKNQALVLAVDTWIAQKDWRKLCETIISYLLKVDADVNSCDTMEKPVLYKAVECNASSLVRLLLDNEAELNCTYQNKTPLAHALQRACPEINSLSTVKERHKFLSICKNLIEAGATFIAISTEIAHYQAIKNFYDNHIKLDQAAFEKDFQWNLQRKSCTSAISLCTPEYAEFIKNMIQQDKDRMLFLIVTHVDTYSSRVEKYAAAIDCLIQNGANVHSRSPDKNVPMLLLAVKGGCIQIVKTLLTHQADVNVTDDQGQTPLHIAVSGYHDDQDVTRCLLEHQANVHAPDKENKTPLSYAIESHNFVEFQMLLEKGATWPLVPDSNPLKARYLQYQSLFQSRQVKSASKNDAIDTESNPAALRTNKSPSL
jgi:ankyrin repeat protein